MRAEREAVAHFGDVTGYSTGGSLHLNDLYQWYPVSLELTEGSPIVEWRYFGGHRFTEPFFEETISAVAPDARKSRRTSVEAFEQFAPDDCLPPTAFLFHASRCGSTLVAQLLANLEPCIVLSEAPVFDSALNLYRDPATRDLGLRVLQGVVRAMGQRRSGKEQHLIFKLDCWHIMHLPLVRLAFPQADLSFLYRDPEEIVSSHRRRRGSRMVPGLLDEDALALDPRPRDPGDLDEYCRRVLLSFFRSAEGHADSGELRLIHYEQLPEVVWDRLAPHLSIPLNEEDLRSMQARSSRHSKYPSEPFVGDPPVPARDADPTTVRALQNHYEALERLRRARAEW